MKTKNRIRSRKPPKLTDIHYSDTNGIVMNGIEIDLPKAFFLQKLQPFFAY